MLNRLLFVIFCILHLFVMCFISILEFIVNAPTFIVFQEYHFHFASDVITKTEELKMWLFGYE